MLIIIIIIRLISIFLMAVGSAHLQCIINVVSNSKLFCKASGFKIAFNDSLFCSSPMHIKCCFKQQTVLQSFLFQNCFVSVCLHNVTNMDTFLHIVAQMSTFFVERAFFILLKMKIIKISFFKYLMEVKYLFYFMKVIGLMVIQKLVYAEYIKAH